MPQVNITISGQANSSVSGVITDPEMLNQLRAVTRHLEAKAQLEPEPVQTAGESTLTGVSPAG